MKIYTKTGDCGETSLFSGKRVSKAECLVKAYGSVDELNSAIGVAIASIDDSDISAPLTSIQHELFQMGADLATPIDEKAKSEKVIRRLTEKEVGRLESEIDRYTEDLPPLKEFILPGGSLTGAHLHLARTICRRTESDVTDLVNLGKANPPVLVYLNRLSDFLFVYARWINQKLDKQEITWKRSPF